MLQRFNLEQTQRALSAESAAHEVKAGLNGLFRHATFQDGKLTSHGTFNRGACEQLIPELVTIATTDAEHPEVLLNRQIARDLLGRMGEQSISEFNRIFREGLPEPRFRSAVTAIFTIFRPYCEAGHISIKRTDGIAEMVRHLERGVEPLNQGWKDLVADTVKLFMNDREWWEPLP